MLVNAFLLQGKIEWLAELDKGVELTSYQQGMSTKIASYILSGSASENKHTFSFSQGHIVRVYVQKMTYLSTVVPLKSLSPGRGALTEI